MRAALCLVVVCAAVSNAGCTATSCTRDPDELYVPLAHNLNLPGAAADAGIAEGGAGGESEADAGAPADPALLDGSVTLGDSYWSAPIGGPYTYFPPFRTVTFEHDLGGIPTQWGSDIAFSSRGTLAENTGNSGEFRDGEDGGVNPMTASTFTIYNNTCSEFYVRLWLRRPSP